MRTPPSPSVGEGQPSVPATATEVEQYIQQVRVVDSAIPVHIPRQVAEARIQNEALLLAVLEAPADDVPPVGRDVVCPFEVLSLSQQAGVGHIQVFESARLRPAHGAESAVALAHRADDDGAVLVRAVRVDPREASGRVAQADVDAPRTLQNVAEADRLVSIIVGEADNHIPVGRDAPRLALIERLISDGCSKIAHPILLRPAEGAELAGGVLCPTHDYRPVGGNTPSPARVAAQRARICQPGTSSPNKGFVISSITYYHTPVR